MQAVGSSPPTPPTRRENAERLFAAKAAWCSDKKFEVGDLVQPAPFVIGPTGRGHVEAVVMETCPNLREMLHDHNLPAGQGILLVFINGQDVSFGWYQAWQYVLAEPLPVRALNA